MNKLKKDQRFHYDVTLVTKYKNIQKVFLLLVFVTLGKVYHCSLPVDALGGHVFFLAEPKCTWQSSSFSSTHPF